ncbi:mucoidy inhibitor MuiA family protein [Orbaceae bacterium ac157xtp]
MKIQNSLFIMMLGALPSIATATTVSADVALNKVTLFMQGAQLQGNASVTIPKGESEILLTHLASEIYPDSINVGMGDKVTILSTTLEDNYLINKQSSNELKELQNQLTKLQADNDKLDIELNVVAEEIALLQGNRLDMLSSPSASIDQAKKVMNFVKTNLTSALSKQNQLKQNQAELQKKITAVESQISEKSDHNDTAKVVKVKVLADENITVPVSVSYVTPDAGWAPTYDVRVKDITSPLSLTYKANIYQQSGLNWKNVDFVISTSNPSLGITAPTLQPWLVGLYGKDKLGSSYESKFVSYDMAESKSVDKRTNKSSYIEQSNNGLNTEFTVTLPYTIHGYSENNIVTLKEKQVTALYRYTATPRLDNSAFLQAEISDWDKLELIPGKSTVYYAGNYVGESFITTQGVDNKLAIALGRDNEILVSLKQNLNETSKPSFFGNNISQKFAYQLDVKNTKQEPISITIYDQLPLILNDTIKMEAKPESATWDKKTGQLKWDIQLAPSKQQNVEYSFILTYPKDKQNMIFGL